MDACMGWINKLLQQLFHELTYEQCLKAGNYVSLMVPSSSCCISVRSLYQLMYVPVGRPACIQ